MNTTRTTLAAALTVALLGPGLARAEGTAQFGPNQDLIERERNYIGGDVQDGPPVTILVDILAVGETINIAAGDDGDGASVYVDLWDAAADPALDPPTASYTIAPGSPAFLPGDGNPAPAIIAAPLRHVTDQVGTWKLRLRQGAEGPCQGTNQACNVDPFDVTVTPPGYAGPIDPYNPPGGYGRVHATHWNFNANSFQNCTNLELYVLTDGGFVDTNFVWLFEAQGFCGYHYNLIANSLGLIPQSGYSLDLGANPPSTTLPQYSIYLNPPEVAKPKGTQTLYIGEFGFRDASGLDQTISITGSPGGSGETPGVQDTGVFSFRTNLETFGTYAIIIDTNRNGVFDPYLEADVLLQDFAYPGDNAINWNGRDPFGVALADGVYDTRVILRVGDFHFAAYDVEYMTPGIRIFEFTEADGVSPPTPATTPTPTFMYWNDSRLMQSKLNNGNDPAITSPITDPLSTGLFTDPVTPGVNAHAWGVGYCCSTTNTNISSGNDAVLDTAVFGKAESLVDRTTIIVWHGNLAAIPNFCAVPGDIGAAPGPALDTAPDSLDIDQDGEPNVSDPDPFDWDADGDGLSDYDEIHGPDGIDLSGDETDPLDVDTDDDGLSDDEEWSTTGTHPALFDSDRDGVWDGVELGRTQPLPGATSSCIGAPVKGTDVTRFRPDADGGATTTDPLDDDSDDDGLLDGQEDKNHDGAVGAKEPDPNATDSDGDTLPDGLEAGLAAPQGSGTDLAIFVADADGGLTKTDPADDDTDDDGLTDGAEDANGDGAVTNTLGGTGTAGSGETHPGRRDTDGDGVQDGTEAGLAAPQGSDTLATVFQPDLDPAQTTDPLDADSDDGGVADGAEDANHDGAVDAAETDPNVTADDDGDGDGLADSQEAALGLDPADADSDDDGLLDGWEVNGTGLLSGWAPTDPTNPDSDGDGLPDGLEVGSLCPSPDSAGCRLDADPASTTDPNDADSDDDGLPDAVEDADGSGAANGGETSAALFDSDGDGLSDGLELGTECGLPETDAAICVADADPTTTTDPTAADTDGDGLTDGAEDANGDGATVATLGGTGTDGSGETDPLDADSDGDGLSDGDEVLGAGPLAAWAPTSPLDSDSDDGGVPDAVEVETDGTDPNDGADDVPDADGDGVKDADEATLGTLPNDADSDDDGLLDGAEVELGLDPLLADSDGDGLADGLELGADCAHADSGAGCVVDANPLTTSDPTDADSDDDGLLDGAEDANGDGALSQGESDPQAFDTDGDGLSDGLELGTDCADPASGPACLVDADPASTTNPASPDTDADGLADGLEDADADGATVNTIGGTNSVGSGETDPDAADTDGDGLSDGHELYGLGPLAPWGPTSPLDTDSDDGGVPDGREVLYDGTDPNDWTDDLPDSDGDGLADALELDAGTDPALADTDGDGLSDGDEVYGLGLLAGWGETSPTLADTDGDGLSDGLEVGTDCAAGGATCAADSDPASLTNPLDADSDDDGRLDGAEDANGDGAVGATETDPRDPDSDDDGVWDGTEVGIGAAMRHSDSAVGTFRPDLDAGATTTNPLVADTDGDGLSDGEEDLNGDGVAPHTLGGVGTTGGGETDPTLADTDGDGLSDGLERGVDGDADPATTTDPLDTDSDDGGLADGLEDANGDGAVGGSETDPLDPADDGALDSDGDGLSDLVEYAHQGLDPYSADSDGDTLADGVEGLVDTDRDGLVDAADNDSDGDGLGDGLEAAGATSPTDDDSDDDGLTDGAEDADADGLVGAGETDPAAFDSDGDGLGDGLELGLMRPQGAHTDGASFVPDADPATTTDPLAADTDGDGLTDGAEDANGNGRAGFGETSPTAADTDGDGLSDGLEVGAAGDADPATTTNPRRIDSDGDGLADGAEDANANGAVDPGESDPNDRTDPALVNTSLSVSAPEPTGCAGAGGQAPTGLALTALLLAFVALQRRRQPKACGRAQPT